MNHEVEVRLIKCPYWEPVADQDNIIQPDGVEGREVWGILSCPKLVPVYNPRDY